MERPEDLLRQVGNASLEALEAVFGGIRILGRSMQLAPQEVELEAGLDPNGVPSV